MSLIVLKFGNEVLMISDNTNDETENIWSCYWSTLNLQVIIIVCCRCGLSPAALGLLVVVWWATWAGLSYTTTTNGEENTLQYRTIMVINIILLLYYSESERSWCFSYYLPCTVQFLDFELSHKNYTKLIFFWIYRTCMHPTGVGSLFSLYLQSNNTSKYKNNLKLRGASSKSTKNKSGSNGKVEISDTTSL